MPDLDGDEELRVWIAHAQAQATLVIAQKLEEIRAELKTLNQRGARGESDS